MVNCFFFKQKTEYEMRISDWSSDVCSSDLLKDRIGATLEVESGANDPMAIFLTLLCVELLTSGAKDISWETLESFIWLFAQQISGGARSADRRVGQVCVSTCRSRWSPYH